MLKHFLPLFVILLPAFVHAQQFIQDQWDAIVPEGAMGFIISTFAKSTEPHVVMLTCSRLFPRVNANVTLATQSWQGSFVLFRLGDKVFSATRFDTANPVASTESARQKWAGQDEFLGLLFAGVPLEVLSPQPNADGSYSVVARFDSPPNPPGLAQLVEHCGKGPRDPRTIRAQPLERDLVSGTWFLRQRSENLATRVAVLLQGTGAGIFGVFCDGQNQPAAYVASGRGKNGDFLELDVQIGSYSAKLPSISHEGLEVFSLNPDAMAALATGATVTVKLGELPVESWPSSGWSGARMYALAGCT